MKMPFRVKYYVYWTDTDAAGIAHFTSFLRLIEHAEEDFYRENGILHYHSIAPRRELFITYTAPLRRGDVAIVELWLDEARTRAIRYRFRVINETTGKNAAEGYLVFTCVNNENGELRAIPCPEELINAWKRTLDSTSTQ
ncbi:thioesterase [Vulcanisaeta souniana JCM 11219]|uniref:Thioesterase n=2 Tax=Vulcanisaeta souniana JCM 11219 TaxID=1293586 RepID=A0A830EEB1_9CREN|nr:thioesterase [Vulcanisaeta souniana JCM 11219]